MDPKVGLDANRLFTSIEHTSNNQVKEQVTHQGYSVASVEPVISRGDQGGREYQQTPISLRKYSPDDDRRSHLFKQIQDIVSGKKGIAVDINKDSLIFDLTKKNNVNQDNYFKYGDYHALIGYVFDGTEIPEIIRAERLIPVVRKGCKAKQLIAEFKVAPEAYVHTLYGQEMLLETKPFTPFYNPQALRDADTSMLRVSMDDLGFTDGSPRYIFTTALAPCICLALFDRSQSKVLLGHFGAEDFSYEHLSDIYKFCDQQQMRSLECHIVGGWYQYLGIENGFLSLIDFVSSKGIPIKQLFVGDTTDRPMSVVVDTRDMSLYGLSFKSLDFPVSVAERFRSKKELKRIAKMFLLTKDHSLSLYTSGSGA
ncbi:hypothetical protein [Endozoicomonas sp. 8E]|uniref:hypothetical protein n=1 Tax=Endozoicomonas sp. 8E TaxID=3035692 RepID=UPI00293953D8|nr:hypothetical protein [Endozoicomonas sp. 8E]WOG30158.1 hypothetical protein P6910_11045 [Endozoicomonas sp. 8E]